MHKSVKSVILVFAALSICRPSFAVDLTSYSVLSEKDTLGAERGNEFISGARKGSVLMRVNIWGAVGKPGIHHVPAKTNLINLLSYAGGPSKNAILDQVLIKRATSTSKKNITVDVQELIEGANATNIPLEPNDIIVVNAEKPWVSQNTAVLIGVISTIFTIVATGFIIDSRRD